MNRPTRSPIISLPLSGIIALFGVAWGSGAALAADAIAIVEVPTQPNPSRYGPVRQKLADWNVVVGGGAIYVSKYEGSDEFKVLPVPFVSATLFDTITVNPGGASVALYDQGPFVFSGLLGYELGRQEDDSDHLEGLGDIDFGVTVGARAGVQWGQAQFYAQIDKTIGGSDGLLGKFGVEFTQPLSESLVLGLGASATVADENHMKSYFGVDAQQSAASGLSEYDPKAGLKRADISLSLTYSVNENWIVRSETQLGLLLGDAADSPVVQDEWQPSTMLVVGYRF